LDFNGLRQEIWVNRKGTFINITCLTSDRPRPSQEYQRNPKNPHAKPCRRTKWSFRKGQESRMEFSEGTTTELLSIADNDQLEERELKLSHREGLIDFSLAVEIRAEQLNNALDA